MEQPLVYRKSLRNLTKLAGQCTVLGGNVPFPFCELFYGYFYGLDDYVKWMSSEEDVIHVMLYPWSWRRLGVVKILPAKAMR